MLMLMEARAIDGSPCSFSVPFPVTLPSERIVQSFASAYACRALMFAMTVATPSRAPSMAMRAPLTLVSARSSEARFEMVVARMAVTALPCDWTACSAPSPCS